MTYQALSSMTMPNDLSSPTFDAEVSSFSVLRVRGRKIAEITTFGVDLLPAFGVPAILGSVSS